MRYVPISIIFLAVALLFLGGVVPGRSQTPAPTPQITTPALPYLLQNQEWNRWPDRVMGHGVRAEPSAGNVMTPNLRCAMLLDAALDENQSIAATGAQIARYLPNTRVWCTDAMKQAYAYRAEHPTPTPEPTPALAPGQSLEVTGLPDGWNQARDDIQRPITSVHAGASSVDVPNPKCGVLLEYALRIHQEEDLTAAQIDHYLPHTKRWCMAAMKSAYTLQDEYEKRETPASPPTR